MESIRRHLLVWSLLSLVLLAPLAAPVGAAGDATTDGNAAADGDATADGDSSADHELLDRELLVTDAVGNVTNATTDALANATNGTLGAVETNGTNRTDRTADTVDGPDDAVGLEATSPAMDAPGRETDRSLALLRPEPPRLAVTDDALVVDLRPLAVDDPPSIAVPLALDGSTDPSAGDGSDPAVDEGEPTPSAATSEEPDDGPTATATATPDAADGSADGDDDGAAGESGTSGDGLGSGVPAEFAPPLGSALFVVAARPWLGLLSGAVAAAANWLGNAFVLLRYGRHDGSDPLEHETRARIHEQVSETPGRSLTELSESLETPLSTVRHHVRILERERVVVSRKLRGNRRIYPVGAENAELAAALEEDSSAAVIAALHEQGRATVGEVVDRVERSYSTVSYHLSRLADEGLVVQEREGRTTLSRLAPDVESLLEAPDDPVAAAPERSGREASADRAYRSVVRYRQRSRSPSARSTPGSDSSAGRTASVHHSSGDP